ncbi:MAG TPA: Ig-like domain-containing protein, partial [Gemmatimonadaceae bacterium]|nr:Ig-like domain-containing protein [Gemmatimonadaceae bacterium]
MMNQASSSSEQSNPPRAPGRRAARAFALLGVAVAAAISVTCFDGSPTAPRLRSGRPGFSVAPSFETLPSGAPTIPLSKIRGVLQRMGGDSVVAESLVQGDSVILVFDVSFTGQDGVFQLSLTAYDTSGQVAFSGIDTIHVAPGDNPPVQPTKPLQYSAPDAKVATIHVVPGTVKLQAGQSANLAVNGTTQAGQPISPIRVGWTSRDATIASVDANGVLKAGAFEGSTWVIARTATNVADSAQVAVQAPAANIAISPAAPSVVRGDSVQLTASVTDAGGHPITSRQPAWSTGDATKATVSSTGWVHGLTLGAAQVTASLDGKTASVTVTVTPAVASVTIAPSPLNLPALTATAALTATPVLKPGVPASRIAGLPTTWKTGNAAIASVDDHGTVTAVGNGTTTITATIDGVDGTVPVTVQQVPTSLHVSPKTSRLTALAITQQFSASGTDAKGQPLAPDAIQWQSLNTAVITVDANGRVTAVGNGATKLVASAGPVADTASVTVSQVATQLRATVQPSSIAVGQRAAILPTILDDNDQPVVTNFAYTSITPTI